MRPLDIVFRDDVFLTQDHMLLFSPAGVNRTPNWRIVLRQFLLSDQSIDNEFIGGILIIEDHMLPFRLWVLKEQETGAVLCASFFCSH